MPPQNVISYQLGKTLAQISAGINRQAALLINRKGHIEYVVLGNAGGIVIPPLDRHRSSLLRLNGLRCVHTHLAGEPLTTDDLVDLALLRLDMMAAIEVGEDGEPGRVHAAHILPSPVEGAGHGFLRPMVLGQAAVTWRFLDIIEALEEELASSQSLPAAGKGKERAVLISISARSARDTKARLDELAELARSAGVKPVGRVIQHQSRRNPKFILGKGKLGELSIYSLQEGATTWIFDQDLSPSQVKSLTGSTDLKIIDRTQLILDIFAQRARSREGKIQVELAQLQYLLPRLVGKNPALSRLAGGIGSRGPGESKLEIDRRRARERVGRLQSELKSVRAQRERQRKQRRKRGLPVVSLVGYTNAGKSTLLNTLTQSQVAVKNKLFATLDPTSRKLYLSPGHEVILTDTVGFIRDLPQDLFEAFKATLEELYDADLLLHLVDGSNPDFEHHIRAVEQILSDLDLDRTRRVMVFNKMDLVDPVIMARLCRRYRAQAIAAVDKSTLSPLTEEIDRLIFNRKGESAWPEAVPGGLTPDDMDAMDLMD